MYRRPREYAVYDLKSNESYIITLNGLSANLAIIKFVNFTGKQINILIYDNVSLYTKNIYKSIILEKDSISYVNVESNKDIAFGAFFPNIKNDYKIIYKKNDEQFYTSLYNKGSIELPAFNTTFKLSPYTLYVIDVYEG
jgi:hypothetical protein